MMLENQTIEQMKQLRLSGMLDAYSHIQQQQALQTLSFSEGLGMLINQEVMHRENKRLTRLIKQAKLRYTHAMVEDINYEHKRQLTPDEFKWLVAASWLNANQNILLIGPTGIGKTYLACACAQLACRKGKSARYFRLSKLFEILRIARADGSYHQVLSKITKVHCLVLDDFGLEPIDQQRRLDLLELIEEQHENRSIIITSQLPIEHWHEYIGDHTVADAMIDRLIERSKIFKLQGESMRKPLESS